MLRGVVLSGKASKHNVEREFIFAVRGGKMGQRASERDGKWVVALRQQSEIQLCPACVFIIVVRRRILVKPAPFETDKAIIKGKHHKEPIYRNVICEPGILQHSEDCFSETGGMWPGRALGEEIWNSTRHPMQ